jgi:hypothetical protein
LKNKLPPLEMVLTTPTFALAEFFLPDSREWKQTDRNSRFRSVFGANSAVVADVWNRIVEADALIDKGAEPKHLLWALVLLKVYQSDKVRCFGFMAVCTNFQEVGLVFCKNNCFVEREYIIILAKRLSESSTNTF